MSLDVRDSRLFHPCDLTGLDAYVSSLVLDPDVDAIQVRALERCSPGDDVVEPGAETGPVKDWWQK